ncbi:MAG: multicopper oxidase family protein [Gemmatimonadales bacterium]
MTLSGFRVLPFALILGTGPALAQTRPCDAASSPDSPSRDLYCMELVAAPGFSGASGRLELGHIPGPFTTAVAPDGRIRFQLILSAAGLPTPSSLGDFTAYVAWVATPDMDSIVRQGVVNNGRTRLGVVDLEKFTFLVTAERSRRPQRPGPRIVLRAQSPATRLFPPDLLQLTLGSMTGPATGEDSAQGSPHHDPASIPDQFGWTTVPMPPGITMLPAEMALRPTITGWLPAGPAEPAQPRELIKLNDGDTLRLEADVVQRTIRGRTYIMFGFNRQHPGPLLEVARNSRITVRFINHLPQPSSVHWHGIRLDNPSDGTPGLTQPAVEPGAELVYHLRFPDAGIYWYHPHVREDLQQELGLYGNLLVRSDSGTLEPVDREAVLMLDDILLSDAGMVPLGRDAPTHALMGRFGNVFLVNGEPDYHLRVTRGEVVRFFLTNAANARMMNLSFPNAWMKLVGSDLGPYQQDEWVSSVVIAPAERYIVDVRFDRTGKVPLLNRVRGLNHLYGRFFDEVDTLGLVEVSAKPASRNPGANFGELKHHAEVAAELDRYRRSAEAAPEKTLVLTLHTMDLPALSQRLMQLDSIYFPPVEWSGTMPMMNWASTGRQVRWILQDRDSGKENMDIDWHFRRGKPVRIKLVNQRQSVHAMQHPIHFHGQRFLIMAVNGEPNHNLVWKDTVLVPAGSTVDILLDPSNPGRWMAHCHIAEHLSAGMMATFTVD